MKASYTRDCATAPARRPYLKILWHCGKVRKRIEPREQNALSSCTRLTGKPSLQTWVEHQSERYCLVTTVNREILANEYWNINQFLELSENGDLSWMHKHNTASSPFKILTNNSDRSRTKHLCVLRRSSFGNHSSKIQLRALATAWTVIFTPHTGPHNILKVQTCTTPAIHQNFL